MTHHTFVEKKLHLRFKGSDRKTKNLIISRPKDKLKKDSANIAMESIIGANLFEKTEYNCMKAEEMLIIRRRVWMFFFNNNK